MFRGKIKIRISIVEKIIYRPLTGQSLGLIFHNHLNSRIYLPELKRAHLNKKTTKKDRSFEKKIGYAFVKHYKFLVY